MILLMMSEDYLKGILKINQFVLKESAVVLEFFLLSGSGL